MSVRKRYDPTFALFVDEPGSAPINGVYHLNPALTINGSTVYPDLRYNGKDATTTGWKPWGYGGSDGNLVIAGTGDLPSCSAGSPLLGPLDDSVKFNSGSNSVIRGQYYQAVNNSIGNIGTEDYVFEIVFKMPTKMLTSTERPFSKWSTAGWFIGINSSGPTISIWLDGGVPTVSIATTSLSFNTWYHALFFGDASGNGQWYINGVASGAPAAISGVGSMIDSQALIIGSDFAVAVSQINVAYFAMWKKASWLDTGASWAGVALERFNRLIGLYPRVSKGTATPVVQTRATSAHIDKVETNGTKKLYQVGSSWLRCASRNDAQGRNIKGYLSEIASTNVIQHSENISVWVKGNATTPSGSVVLPNGVVSTTATFHEDATAATVHYLAPIAGFNVANGSKYVYSCWFKAINRNWVTLTQDGALPPNASTWFNLSGTGSIGLSQFTNDAGIESWGNGWFRCWQSFTFTAGGVGTVTIYLGNSTPNNSFNGLDQDSIYVFGMQVETGVDAPTSYIYASGSTATRNGDALYYKGDDGNLGGVGSDLKGNLELKLLHPAVTNNFTSSSFLFSLSAGGSGLDYLTFAIAKPSKIHNFYCASTEGGVGNINQNGTGSLADNNITKIKCSWKPNLAITTIDNVREAAIDTSCLAPNDLDRIEIGTTFNANQTIGALISNFKIWRKPNNTR